jgi:predicted transcriptional regulator
MTHKTPPSPAPLAPLGDEARLAEQFLDEFADVELALKRRLGRRHTDRTGFTDLIELYAKVNPRWRDTAVLLHRLCAVRNILVHERTARDGYPLSVPAVTVDRLHRIRHGLESPEPVSARYTRPVTKVALADTLAFVLAIAYEKEYSQFPVVDAGRFRALITENGITRYLGRHVKARGPVADFREITVARVVCEEEKEKGRKGEIYSFKPADTPVDEVMGLFANRLMLEAVLITRTGKSGTEPLIGIVTEWDASRFL